MGNRNTFHLIAHKLMNMMNIPPVVAGVQSKNINQQIYVETLMKARNYLQQQRKVEVTKNVKRIIKTDIKVKRKKRKINTRTKRRIKREKSLININKRIKTETKIRKRKEKKQNIEKVKRRKIKVKKNQ